MGLEEIHKITKKLIESVQQSDIHELEISNSEWKIRIVRGCGGITSAAPTMVSVPAVMPTVSPHSSDTPGVLSAPSPESSPPHRVEIVSPMVGTFYRAPTPDAPPFVKEQDGIAPGQVVCIIEAMKLMNEIQSDIKGRILEILVENAQPVEYGQPLFVLEPM